MNSPDFKAKKDRRLARLKRVRLAVGELNELARRRAPLNRDEDRTVAQMMRDADARPRSRRAVGQYGLMEDERDPHDNYETPPDAVHQLLSNVKLDGGVWDPSCGRGNIVRTMIEAGRSASGSDKYRWPTPGLRLGVDVSFDYDFLKSMETPSNIVMNPPYSKADEHVRHALRIVENDRLVCVLLRLTWVAAQKRADLLKHLTKVIIVGRLKMLPPDVPDRGHNGAVDFAWFVFVPRVVESTTIVRAK